MLIFPSLVKFPNMQNVHFPIFLYNGAVSSISDVSINTWNNLDEFKVSWVSFTKYSFKQNEHFSKGTTLKNSLE